MKGRKRHYLEWSIKTDFGDVRIRSATKEDKSLVRRRAEAIRNHSPNKIFNMVLVTHEELD